MDTVFPISCTLKIPANDIFVILSRPTYSIATATDVGASLILAVGSTCSEAPEVLKKEGFAGYFQAPALTEPTARGCKTRPHESGPESLDPLGTRPEDQHPKTHILWSLSETIRDHVYVTAMYIYVHVRVY